MYAEDQTFRGRIDDFIQQNIQNVVNSKHFFGLPELKMEIIGEEEAGAKTLRGGGGGGELLKDRVECARAFPRCLLARTT